MITWLTFIFEDTAHVSVTGGEKPIRDGYKMGLRFHFKTCSWEYFQDPKIKVLTMLALDFLRNAIHDCVNGPLYSEASRNMKSK